MRRINDFRPFRTFPQDFLLSLLDFFIFYEKNNKK